MTPEIETKPFPWTCFSCGRREVVPAVGPYSTRVKHDGRSYKLEILDLKAPRCANCGDLQITNAADEQIRVALREKVGLLSPEEIRRNRTELGLTQRALAEHLGTAEATISRWETEALVQSKAMDKLLRLYFAFPQARAALENRSSELGCHINRQPRRVSGRTASRFSTLRTLAEQLSRREADSALQRLRGDQSLKRREMFAGGFRLLLHTCGSEPCPEAVFLVSRTSEPSLFETRGAVRWVSQTAGSGKACGPLALQMDDWLNAMEAVPPHNRAQVLKQCSDLFRTLTVPNPAASRARAGCSSPRIS